MALYLIGIGLGDEKDITLSGLEAAKRCSALYLESYTSKLAEDVDLGRYYGKKIIKAKREDIENKASDIIDSAKDKDIGILVVGDPLGATTHISLLLEAKKKGIDVRIIHNASILTAVGEVGLELYKFGHVTSIPFNNKDIKTPIEIFKRNYKANLHTLFLLDLSSGKYMGIPEAADYLLSNGLDENLRAIGCAGIGSINAEIKAGNLRGLRQYKFTLYPQCLIIPAKKLHFMEQEALKLLDAGSV